MWYRTGTIAATKSSKTVTGTGTKWADAKQGVGPGQMLLLPAAGTVVMYEIASVQSNTQLTLVDAFTGNTVTAQAYAIVTTYIDSVPDFARRLASQLSDYQNQLDGWQSILTGTGDVTLTAPDGTTVTVASMSKMQGDYLSTTKTTDQSVKSAVSFGKPIVGSIDKGFQTGLYTTGGENSSAAISAESGWAMLWRNNGLTGKGNEFIGIDKNSQLVFRRDTGKGDGTTQDALIAPYADLNNASWTISNNVGGVENWIKVATVTGFGQGGTTLRLDLAGGSGYNGTVAQNGFATIIIRTGNGQSTVVNTAGRASATMVSYLSAAVKDLGLIETANGVFDIYLKLGAYCLGLVVTLTSKDISFGYKNLTTKNELQATAPVFTLAANKKSVLLEGQAVSDNFTFNADVSGSTFNGKTFKATGLGSGNLPTEQGAYLSWNYLAGSGQTDLICHRGVGTGGWNFWLLNNAGDLSKVSAITTDGRINLSGSSSGILWNDTAGVENAMIYTEPTGRVNFRVGQKAYTHIFTETGIIAAHIGLQPGRVALSYTDIQSGTIPNTGSASYIIRGADGANYNELCNMNFVSWYGVGFVPNVSTSLASGVTHGKPCVFVNTRTGYVEAINGFRHNGSVVYSTRNTTVDTNGYIKPASPIIKLFGNGVIENNESAVGTIAERVDRGIYRLSGMLGFNADALWGGNDGGISIPEDKNKQPLIWVDYDVEASGDILIKTYHRTHPDAPVFARNVKEGYENGDPIDIPDGRWIDLRIYMPVNDVEEVTDVDETPPEPAI